MAFSSCMASGLRSTLGLSTTIDPRMLLTVACYSVDHVPIDDVLPKLEYCIGTPTLPLISLP